MLHKAGFFITPRRVMIYALLLAVLSWSFFLTFAIPEQNPGQDFKAFYAASVLANADPANVYSNDAQYDVQKSLGAGVHFHYLNPPFFTVALIPLARLPYRQAYWLWTAASVVFYFGAIALLIFGWFSSSPRRVLIMLVAAASPAFHWSMITGQSTSLSLFLWTWALYLLTRERFVTVGVAFGLLLLRAHYLVLVFPVMLWKKLRAPSISFALVACSLLLAGSIVFSLSSYFRYLEVLAEFSTRIATEQQPLSRHITLYGMFRTWLPHSWALPLTLVAMMPLVYWLAKVWRDAIAFRQPMFEIQFASLVTTTLLMMHHGLIYDLVLMTIPALLMYKNNRFFPQYYKILLALLYFAPYVFIVFTGKLPGNPVQPLLYWTAFEIFRAHQKMTASRSGS